VLDRVTDIDKSFLASPSWALLSAFFGVGMK
jgi:hypothetical protein